MENGSDEELLNGINKDLMLIKKLKAEDREKNIEARQIVEFIRPEIIKAAMEMEKTMRIHDPKKGDSHKTCKVEFLCCKLQEEYKETEQEMYNLLFKDSNDLCHELIDLINVAMMTWNRVNEE